MARNLVKSTSPAAGRKPTHRGMALLLVLIGMIVCTILTAGFLSSQGTSIGIARNERDAAKARAIAQTGIDMCYWLIKNKTDWRETMSPGAWLSNAAVGDGTVTVTAADGNSASSFATDPTQAVVLTSTGTYDSRTYVLTATIRPTGGGTVFKNGNFISGNILLGNSDLVTTAVIDSYNSSIAAYNSLAPGSNAQFISNSTGNGSLTQYYPSPFRGSYSAGPGAVLSNAVALYGPTTGPSSQSTASESRNPGSVVFPNTTGLTSKSAISLSSSSATASPGQFPSISVASGTLTFGTTGTYYITGNVTIGSTSTSVLMVSDNVTATVIIDGNLSITTGKIQLGSTGNGKLALYVKGNVTLSNGSINNLGTTSRFNLFGSSGCGQVTLTSSSAAIYGTIFAPQANVTLQTGSPKIFGAVVASQLTVKNTAAVHFDEALRTLKFSNITGGSAAPGTADYRVSITGGPGVLR